MLTKNFAVLDKDSDSLVKSVLQNKNVKRLTKEELEFAEYDESYNPFDHPDYWIMVRKFFLKKSNFKVRNRYEQKFAFLKLITVAEFRQLDFNKTHSEFVNSFLDWSGGHRHSVLGNLKLETYNQFVDRCKSKFNSDYIYRIVPRISSTSIENNLLVPNNNSLVPLKDLVIEFCNELERHNKNYIIEPEISRLNDGISDLQDADHSWGHHDPYGLS